jgi:uncharacterized protein YjbI with pentapeptide repeats
MSKKKKSKIMNTKSPSSALVKLSQEDVESAILNNDVSDGIDFSHKDLSDLDLSNRNLKKAKFKGSKLCRVKFQNSDLSDSIITEANCADANFSEAKLSRADLTNSYFRNTTFFRASLYRAKLCGAVFPQANLKMTSIYRAVLKDAELRKENFGNKILQDSKSEFDNYLKKYLSHYNNDPEGVKRHHRGRIHEVVESYRSLKKLFLDSGRYADASWAYIRERQARRRSHFFTNAKYYYNMEVESLSKPNFIGHSIFYINHFLRWLLDWIAELSCGYGEKPLRTLFWAIIIIPIFALMFYLSNGIISNSGSMTWIDYFNYSAASFSTIGFNQYTATISFSQTLTSIEALFGIALVALLMYALGNKISRS